MANLSYIDCRTDLYISIIVPVRCYGPPQWHLSRPHLSWLHLSLSGIFQLVLTKFRPNFKGRFLGQSLTDVNCCGDIYPGNICPGNICPSECLYSFWPNFDQTFGPNIFWALLFLDKNFIWLAMLCHKFFEPQNLDGQMPLAGLIFLQFHFLHKNTDYWVASSSWSELGSAQPQLVFVWKAPLTNK